MKEVKDYEAQSEKTVGNVSHFYHGIFHRIFSSSKRHTALLYHGTGHRNARDHNRDLPCEFSVPGLQTKSSRNPCRQLFRRPVQPGTGQERLPKITAVYEKLFYI